MKKEAIYESLQMGWRTHHVEVCIPRLLQMSAHNAVRIDSELIGPVGVELGTYTLHFKRTGRTADMLAFRGSRLCFVVLILL